MFSLERDPWLKAMDFVHNITIPGLSPVYPDIHCTTNYTICQITTEKVKLMLLVQFQH